MQRILQEYGEGEMSPRLVANGVNEGLIRFWYQHCPCYGKKAMVKISKSSRNLRKLFFFFLSVRMKGVITSSFGFLVEKR